MRWLYDYDYKDKNVWNSRSEVGWVCPIKLCSKSIKTEDVMSAVEKELQIGRNRDWRFKDYKYEYFSSISSIGNTRT